MSTWMSSRGCSPLVTAHRLGRRVALPIEIERTPGEVPQVRLVKRGEEGIYVRHALAASKCLHLLAPARLQDGLEVSSLRGWVRYSLAGLAKI